MSKPLVVSWFSAGVSSAVATWLMRDQLDHIIYTHIDDQHPDTMRFVKDCEAWFGKTVEVIQSPYRNVEAAVQAGGSRFVNGPTGANCTRYLKKRVRKEWETEHEWFCKFAYVWGYDRDEMKRVERIRETMPEQTHIFPLVDRKINKEEAHAILEQAGINRPAMYDLGYHNNNCIGCVKGGMGYWNKIRKDFPDVFKRRADMERMIGGTCINGVYLDELDPERGRDEGPIVPECGAACEMLANAPLHGRETRTVGEDVG